MTFSELVKKCRSYRRFDETKPVPMSVLEELVDLARMTASGANMQPLKYMLSTDAEVNEKIFSCAGWAGYLAYWPGPAKGERPTGYIVVLHDKNVASDAGCDHGIAAQTIMLGAVEQGFGGCMLGALNRNKLRELLDIEQHLDILLVLALGTPAEECALDLLGEDGSIKYWRDDDDLHHVPKRGLTEIIVRKNE